MSPLELRVTIGLAAIFGFRMLGLFIVLPIFSIYLGMSSNVNSQLMIGLAMGIYGLTQAAMQIPFGRLSDHWGRKRTIYLGLGIFAFGSFLAAIAENIYLLIVGRAIQGAGAISAVVIALASDLTSSENRTKVMAVIGMTIGATFILSLLIGPIVGDLIGISGIFLATGILAGAGALVLGLIVPEERKVAITKKDSASVIDVLKNIELVRLYIGIFFLHGILMALFVVVPIIFLDFRPVERHWQLYCPILLCSVALMILAIRLSGKSNMQRFVFFASISLIGLACLLIAIFSHIFPVLLLAMTIFFGAFNFLEAFLPSMASKIAPVKSRGTALGVYSTAQFLGVFSGSLLAGFLTDMAGGKFVLYFCAIIALVWILVTSRIRLQS